MIDLVVLTYPDAAGAHALVSRLVRERLIACGHLLPAGTSIYLWEGEVRTEPETTILIKASRKNREALEKEILREHPYRVPEILFIAVDHGESSYLSWVQECCRHSPDLPGPHVAP